MGEPDSQTGLRIKNEEREAETGGQQSRENPIILLCKEHPEQNSQPDNQIETQKGALSLLEPVQGVQPTQYHLIRVEMRQVMYLMCLLNRRENLENITLATHGSKLHECSFSDWNLGSRLLATNSLNLMRICYR